MNKTSLEQIDFYKIRCILSAFCLSVEGKDAFLKIEPSNDEGKIEEQKKLIRDISTLISEKSFSRFEVWPSVTEIFKKIAVSGAVLNIDEVFAVFQFCRAVKKTTLTIKNANEKLNLKNAFSLVSSIPDISFVQNETEKIVTENGELRDTNETLEIKAKIEKLSAKIKSTIRHFTTDVKFADALESNVPVLKNSRQVLAVKQSRKNSIQGIVHEISKTGKTIFIEPEDCVRFSNELIEAQSELDAAIRKILADYTKKIMPYSSNLLFSLEIMIKLDCSQAIAKWGCENNCVFAVSGGLTEKNGENGGQKGETLLLREARHPLLKNPVPLDISFSGNERILIISGPNAGGKTVALKTIALFAMMNQASFPLPCKEVALLPIFSEIFVDIGDGQSIEASLSTFSSHLKNIAVAVDGADEKSLVLLDELGSGTDAQEGSAISMACLDYFIEKKSWVLASTHLGTVKNYGYAHKECVSAGVEFSRKSLSPTYRMLLGVTGESHALDIAKKSGIAEKIIENAKNYISGGQANISELMKAIIEKNKLLDEKLSEFDKMKAEFLEKVRKNDLKSLSLRQKEAEIKAEQQKKESEFLAETRKSLENLVRTLKEGEVTKEKTKSVRKFLDDARADIEKRQEELDNSIFFMESGADIEKEQTDIEKGRTDIEQTVCHQRTVRNVNVNVNDSRTRTFSVGDEVKLAGKRETGVIVAKAGKEKWIIEIGNVRLTVKEREIAFPQLAHTTQEVRNVQNRDLRSIREPQRQPLYSFDLSSETKSEKPVFELRLLGMRAVDAMSALERQINLCIIHNFTHFSVIHGKGDGILQNAVHEYLEKCENVESFEFASPEDGGTGKTYVNIGSRF